MLRTHTCGELNKTYIGKRVTLCGWVHSRRDHGDLIFIDIRDTYGVSQVVFDPKENRSLHDKAHELKAEYVIRAEGVVRQRPDGTKNSKLATGDIEVLINGFEILNVALTPPFEVSDSSLVADETRFKYRYIDLRRPAMQKNLRTRHKIYSAAREVLEKENFVEVETPFLTKSTPEGARDFLVPSRLNAGMFYALPQSPQLFKQILMVAGLDRYFQIVRCFRDEDLRKDRQPEFTQLDMEMSFVDEDDVYKISEAFIKEAFKKALKIEIKTPFKRMAYQEARGRFGTDKPDTRFGMEIEFLNDELKDTSFKIFKSKLEENALIGAINLKGKGDLSRSAIDGLIEKAKSYGAGGMAYFKCEKGRLASNIDKFFKPEELEAVKNKTKAEDGDLVLIVAEEKETALDVLGSLRISLAEKHSLIDKKKHSFLWITDFPLFKYNKDEKRWDSEHHPFTSCREEDASFLDEGKFGKIRARSYDLVINGQEIASGSIRIHDRKIQEKIFGIIGLGKEEAEKRFGFLLEAFAYGAPPHGGIAFGLDRLATIFTGSTTIRDVIAFPKTQKAICLMTGAPSDVDDKQLRELNIKKIGRL
ncbi:MAG: aspartate--tRNA ligase [Candidatus Omnitrophica bacterium]|nr:aspartate--tRNA ligase [Candidatus Omnitrophota bacterium]